MRQIDLTGINIDHVQFINQNSRKLGKVAIRPHMEACKKPEKEEALKKQTTSA